MMKTCLITSVVLLVSSLSGAPAWAHCEIPCGIYDDEMRIRMIEEHITTIEKAMKMIQELSSEKKVNYNQLARWISNKESHAEEIQTIISQYFMTQRVKAADESAPMEFAKYKKQLILLHQMLVQAMKAKQGIDPDHATKLRALSEDFRKAYFGKQGETHGH